MQREQTSHYDCFYKSTLPVQPTQIIFFLITNTNVNLLSLSLRFLYSRFMFTKCYFCVAMQVYISLLAFKSLDNIYIFRTLTKTLNFSGWKEQFHFSCRQWYMNIFIPPLQRIYSTAARWILHSDKLILDSFFLTLQMSHQNLILLLSLTVSMALTFISAYKLCSSEQSPSLRTTILKQ